MKAKIQKRTRRVADPMSYFKTEWIDVDVDEHWSFLESLSEDERISKLCERHTWDIILDDFKETPEFREVFKKAFFTGKATDERHKTIYGVSASKNILSVLIRAARAHENYNLAIFLDHDGPSDTSPLFIDEDGREWDAQLIGNVFSRWVCSEDLKDRAKQFVNLADAEKTSKKRVSEGHEHTNAGLVWRAFCELVLKSHQIPSTVDINDVIGRRWRKRSVDPSQMSRICKSLGISRTNPKEKSN